MKQKTIADVMSPKEMKGILSLVALNKLWPKDEIVKKWSVLGFEIKFRWRSKKNLWGRFGGGWNWALGFEASGRSINIMLLIFTIRIHKPKKEGKETPCP